MGWTTTAGRVSYVAGPALAAVLLLNPYETKSQELEEIEIRR